MRIRFRSLPMLVLVCSVSGCAKDDEPKAPAESIPSVPVQAIPGHESVAQDNTVKEGPRLIPAETYMRSYLMLFGGLAPIEAQAALRGPENNGNTFDTWRDYLGAMGMPDYANDVARASQTNALMVALFERVGVALCDRALQNDWKATPKKGVSERLIFRFDPSSAPTVDEFGAAFDGMHRMFLGYPVKLAPTDRTKRFYALYTDVVTRHQASDASVSFTPVEAAWASVCYGLIRHPEFHVY